MPSVWRQQFHVAIALRNALRSRRAHHDISDNKHFRELTTCWPSRCSAEIPVFNPGVGFLNHS